MKNESRSYESSSDKRVSDNFLIQVTMVFKAIFRKTQTFFCLTVTEYRDYKL